MSKHIWFHLKYKCVVKQEKNIEKACQQFATKGPIVESSALLNGILATNFSASFVDSMLNTFKNYSISGTCKSDNTVLRFGAFLYEKYSNTQCELIRQSMRQLGRLIMELKRHRHVFENLSEMLIPEHFDTIVNATKVSQQIKV